MVLGLLCQNMDEDQTHMFLVINHNITDILERTGVP